MTEALDSQRLTANSPERSWRGHIFRYQLAAGFVTDQDTVVDAACGTGYGKNCLGECDYRGVDYDPEVNPPIKADLHEWVPLFNFDVFIGFETIEHLLDYQAYVAAAKLARKWIIISTPIVPTTHLNPHHAQNFAPGELASLFIDGNWDYYQGIIQPAELSEVCIFKRRMGGPGWPE